MNWQLKILTPFIFLANFLVTTGVIYGWIGLQILFKSEGLFACRDVESTTLSAIDCPSQDSDLNLIATIGFSLANLATVVHGFTLDHWGVRITGIIGGIVFTLGMAGLSQFSSLVGLTVSFTAVGWGGIAVFLSSLQFAHLFDRPNWIRAILNALFTAAGCVFTIVNFMYTAHIPRSTSLAAYAILSSVITIGIALTWPRLAYQTGDECSMPVVEWMTGKKPITNSEFRSVNQSNTASDHQHSDVESDIEEKSMKQSIKRSIRKIKQPKMSDSEHIERAGLLTSDEEQSSAYDQSNNQEYDSHSVTSDIAGGVDSLHDHVTGKPLRAHHHVDENEINHSINQPDAAEAHKNSLSLRAECLSPAMIFLALFFSFGLLVGNWFNATIAIQLEAMGDGGGWATAFIFIASFVPIVWSAVIDRMIEKIHYSGCIYVCAISSIASYAVLFAPYLELQIVSFAAYTLARALVVTVMFTYVATQYRHDHYGRLVAFVTIIAVPIGFIQLGMQAATEHLSYKAVNAACMIGTLPAFLYARWLQNRKI